MMVLGREPASPRLLLPPPLLLLPLLLALPATVAAPSPPAAPNLRVGGGAIPSSFRFGVRRGPRHSNGLGRHSWRLSPHAAAGMGEGRQLGQLFREFGRQSESALVIPRDLGRHQLDEYERLVQATPDYKESATVSLEHLQEDVIDRLLEPLPPSSLKRELERDIVELSHEFARLNKAERVTIQVMLTREQRCPRLHVDKVPSRLLLTYAGPGTDYIDRGSPNPLMIPPKSWQDSKLGRLFIGIRNGIAARLSNEDFNSLVLLPGARLEQMNPGDILLLKGTEWRHGCDGAVHRSPLIYDDEARLVLTLDVAENE